LGGSAPESPLSLVTGHLAMGTATVVREPITGEKRLDVEYQQIYAHGANGTIAGTQSWNAYMGSLERGYVWKSPISDVLIRNPAFTYDFTSKDGEKFNVLDGDSDPTFKGFYRGILDELLHTAQNFRIGKTGDGLSEVTPWTSCTQDTAKSLYFAAKRFRRGFESTKTPADLLSPQTTEAELELFNRLDQFSIQMLKALKVGIFPTREDWEVEEKFVAELDTLIGMNKDLTEQQFVKYASEIKTMDAQKPSIVRNVARALGSLATMIPRHSHDYLAKVFLEMPGSFGWIVRTNQMGVNWPGICPMSPSSITLRDVRSGKGNVCP
jgi:predicted Abi (CAAX) family protease